MAKTIFLCGHGGWKMKDGFTSLPKGVSFTFYSHAHKTIYQSAVEEIVAGNYSGWSDEFSEYQNVQNMTLHPDDPHNIAPTKNALKNNPDKNAQVYFAKKAVTLKTLFKANADWIRKYAPVHFVWTC